MRMTALALRGVVGLARQVTDYRHARAVIQRMAKAAVADVVFVCTRPTATIDAYLIDSHFAVNERFNRRHGTPVHEPGFFTLRLDEELADPHSALGEAKPLRRYSLPQFSAHRIESKPWKFNRIESWCWRESGTGWPVSSQLSARKNLLPIS